MAIPAARPSLPEHSQLGNGGTSGSITGNVANNGVLTSTARTVCPFAGAITGGGAANQIGTGTTILTADSSYTRRHDDQRGHAAARRRRHDRRHHRRRREQCHAAPSTASDAMTFAGLISGAGTRNPDRYAARPSSPAQAPIAAAPRFRRARCNWALAGRAVRHHRQRAQQRRAGIQPLGRCDLCRPDHRQRIGQPVRLPARRC